MDRLKRRALHRHQLRCGKQLRPKEKPPPGWWAMTFSLRRIYRVAYPNQRTRRRKCREAQRNLNRNGRLPEGVWFDAPARHGARIRGRAVVSAHLMADTTERLVAFALSIGLQERWIQHRGEYKEHFDLMGEAMCAKAEAAGAERLDRHEFVRRLRLNRGP